MNRIYMNNNFLHNIKWKYTTVKSYRDYKEVENIITFDIETSSGQLCSDGVVREFNLQNIDDNSPSYATMYVYQCGVENGDNNNIYMGRTWEECKKFFNELAISAQLNAVGIKGIDGEAREEISKNVKGVTLRIYIHNLGYEFQFLRNIFENEFSRTRKTEGKNVFARNSRRPMYAKIKLGKNIIIFSDTLVLTQKSLRKWGIDDNLEVQKIEEPKNFYLPVRGSKTDLTKEEIDYCVNDVVTMIYGLKKYRDKYGYLYNIPITQTGAIRRDCEEHIGQADTEWAETCRAITMKYSWDSYVDLNTLFVGGWTHANASYVNRVVKDVKCFDFRSSYPAVMVSRTFPIGEFLPATIDEIEELETIDVNNRAYRFYIEVKFYDVISNLDNTFWSASKSIEIKGEIQDNGKIFSCDYLHCMMTDLDYEIFKKAYSIDKIEIVRRYKAIAGYLPKEFIKTLLKYYGMKTSLKGVEGAESKYNESKQWINSIYGCCVTRLVSDVIEFNKGWVKKKPGPEELGERIEREVKKDMWGTYQIGCWVTAWARHNLWDVIYELDSHVVYCDTDSIKGVFTDSDMNYINSYNVKVKREYTKVADFYNLPVELWEPKTVKGKPKEIGYFDREEDCLEFKTLGAKRYVDTVKMPKEHAKGHIIGYDGESAIILQATIAGLPKKNARKKFNSVSEFRPDTFWNARESGKLSSIYNDEQPPLIWEDRAGNKFKSTDKHTITLKPTTFDLSITEEYEMLIDVFTSQGGVYFNTPEVIRLAIINRKNS